MPIAQTGSYAIDHARDVVVGNAFEPALELAQNDVECAPAVVFVLSLADAQNRRHPMVKRGEHLPVNQLVGLMKDMAALGMADDDVSDAVSVSIGGETSPVNAPLSSKCMFCAPSRIDEPASACATAGIRIVGRRDHHVAILRQRRRDGSISARIRSISARALDRQQIHLPVPGD